MDRGRQEVEEWKKGEKVMLSMKDLVFKKRLVKKVDEKISETIWNRRSSIKECSEAKTASLYEDSSGGEC